MWTSLHSGLPCGCDWPVLLINPPTKAEQVEGVQGSARSVFKAEAGQAGHTHEVGSGRDTALEQATSWFSLCLPLCASVCVWTVCLASLTPSLFCPLFASISCRARTDRDCSSTKVQMHRSGGTYCNGRDEDAIQKKTSCQVHKLLLCLCRCLKLIRQPANTHSLDTS